LRDTKRRHEINIKANHPKVIASITKNLQEFGYEDLTVDVVQEKVDALIRGEEPTEIIGMMAKNMLIENGLLEDEE